MGRQIKTCTLTSKTPFWIVSVGRDLVVVFELPSVLCTSVVVKVPRRRRDVRFDEVLAEKLMGYSAVCAP